MADNIKIIGNVSNASVPSRYSSKDTKLISSTLLQEYFGGSNDYIEYYVYDLNGNIINSNYNYLNYKLPSTSGLKPGVSTLPNTTGHIQTTNVGITSTLASDTGSLYPIIEIDPLQDIQNQRYSSGEFIVKYYFFQNKISNSLNKELFIKEISSDRTEIRLASAILTDIEIEEATLSLINSINQSSYYVDYLLNFGEDKQYLAINVALNKNSEGYEILFKLYQPLPQEIQEKDTLWIVEEIVSPYNFNINLDVEFSPSSITSSLRGPNFDINIEHQGTIATSYTNYQGLISNLQALQSSSYNQIQNLLNTQSVDININYAVSESADFGNFVFFGSAYQRLVNFYTKIKQIEDYNKLIQTYNSNLSTNPSLQTDINFFSSSINTVISQFDGYESYLYFESSSYTWPKSGSFKPYTLLSTGSLSGSLWYGNQTGSAQSYDEINSNNLEYAIPSFIKDDIQNQPFLTFLNMVGHYFDNIWIYIKSIPDINKANNNLEEGISKDLVYDKLQSLGIKLYNSQAGEALDSFLIGANTGSTIWNNNFSITSSYLNNIPRKDLVSELYKRIYHNLPLLLKQKGTVEGLDNLMTVFGIPNRGYYTIISGSISESFYTPTGSNYTASILNVKEYGGSLKSGQLKGYNDDKVRITSNDIVTGSVLSPLMSLQTYPSKSAQFRDNDLNYIDISFSPQNQINTYISKSISSSNATWSLDDYIGDPRYLYSSSYVPLDTERTKYFQVGVTGYAPFTASALDYNGFIRLIEYFDNALFKMFEDFVPERTSLSTGVTIESPVLERNKAVYANPTTTTTQSVYNANYSASGISSDYGHFYDALTGSKKAWYDGDITGSNIDVYDYFESNNFNPYLQADSSSLTTQSIYDFQHSDFNVLLNNVSKSVTSNKRQHIEYVWGSTGSILTAPELQDSYLTLRSYNTSRYNGSKTYSLTYNTYTSASIIFDSSINNVTYSYISSSHNWDDINDGISGNSSYTTLYLTGSTSQLANIMATLSVPEIDYISFLNTNPRIDAITNKKYRIYQFQYYRFTDLNPPVTITYDYTKLAIALSPALTTGISPTITSNYGPGNLTLNFYKSYTGDYSYGNTTSIDHNSYKLGWVRTIQSQSLNFYEKTTLNLKYLIDSNLQITELSSNNINLFEVQNIFKSGAPVKVSVTNVNSPSNQITLDGVKTIFRGGYRYDPIFYREDSELVTFTFDEAISQETDYLGLTARGNDKYYYAANTKFSSGIPLSSTSTIDPPNLNGNYNYGSSEGVVSQPMADSVYDETTWLSYITSNFTSNTRVNFNFGAYTAGVVSIQKQVYGFNLIKLNTLLRNTDSPSNDNYNSTDSTWFYKASRTSNSYRFKGQVPFWFNYSNDPNYTAGVADRVLFKVVALFEKNNNLDNPLGWTPIAASTNLSLSDNGTNLFTVSNYNIMYNDTSPTRGSYGDRWIQCTFNEEDITLNKGDYVRIKLYLIQYRNIFRQNNTGTYLQNIQFNLGAVIGNNSTRTFTSSELAFTQVDDLNTAYDVFNYTSSYTGLQPLFTTSSANSIDFAVSMSQYFDSSSVFTPEPTSPTTTHYTNIIDNFFIQKGDLFRVGKFRNRKPTYYTVSDVSRIEQKDPVTLTGTLDDNYYYNPIPGVITPAYVGPSLIFTTAIALSSNIAVGDVITIVTGTQTITEATVTGRLITTLFHHGSQYTIFTLDTSVADESSVSMNISFIGDHYRVYFDSNFLPNYIPTPSNFAILRPKPDETTVIIDYLKKPGEVSQTLLIPNDASSTLKNKVGDIFDYYNVKLNPNTNQATG